MTKKEFLNAVSNGKEDIIQIFLDALTTSKANYCVIGGLAVNAYAEPVVSLDPRYQDFIGRAASHTVLGYQMNVARIEDVLQGKIWAYLDEERRKSKRQKNLANIIRPTEEDPSLIDRIPTSTKERVE